MSVLAYTDKVKHALDEAGLNLIEIENPEPLLGRLSKWGVDGEIMTMAKTVRRIDSVTFGTFYKYDNEEEPDEEKNVQTVFKKL